MLIDVNNALLLAKTAFLVKTWFTKYQILLMSDMRVQVQYGLQFGENGFICPKVLKMAKIETFRDISRNVEIKVLWS